MKVTSLLSLAFVSSFTLLVACSNMQSKADADCHHSNGASSECDEAKTAGASGAGVPASPH
jgi:hypothetical protein